MNNKKNLKNILNDDLQDLQVTEWLKKKTLYKCNQLHRTKNRKLKYTYLSIAAMFILAVSLTSYIKLHNGIHTINNNKQIAKDDTGKKHKFKDETHNSKTESDNKDIYFEKNTQDDIFKKENLDTDTSVNTKKILQEENISSVSLKNSYKENTLINNEIKENMALNSNTDLNEKEINLDKNDKNHDLINITNTPNKNVSTTNSLENKVESNINLPTYIPNGYKLSKVSKPDNEKKDLILNFSNNSNHFQIIQSKLDHTKSSLINLAENNSLTLIKNNNRYIIIGDLSKDILMKIINSIEQ